MCLLTYEPLYNWDITTRSVSAFCSCRGVSNSPRGPLLTEAVMGVGGRGRHLALGEQEQSGRQHEVTYWSLVHWSPAKSAPSLGSKAQKIELWLCSCSSANGGGCHCTTQPSTPLGALLQLTKLSFPPELAPHFLAWCMCCAQW